MSARCNIIIILLLFVFFLHAYDDQVEHAIITINTDQDAVACADAVESLFSEPCLIESISYACDTHLDDHEFYYLLGFKQGDMVTDVDVKNALFCLSQKNKFKQICMRVEQGMQGKKLHYDCTTHWIFKQLKIEGIWFNKDSYRNHYLLEPGEVFDENKHAHSLEKLEALFRSTGYYNNKVAAKNFYDESDKTVSVTLSLYKGTQFTIKKIDFVVQVEENLPEQEIQGIENQLNRKYRSSLQKHYYAKDLLQNDITAIKNFLMELGFLDTTIGIEEVIDYDQASLVLKISVKLYHKKICIFFGNSFFSNHFLFDHLSNFGRSTWLLPTSILAEEFVALYHAKGFLQVHIQTREEDDRSFFIITENQRAFIGDIIINNHKQDKYSKLIKQCFSSIYKKYFDAAAFDSALQELITYYNKDGFLHFRIVDFELQEQVGTKNNYQIAITIEEGSPYYVASLRIDYKDELLEKGPFKKISTLLKEGKEVPFSYALIEEQKQWLYNYLQQQGYFNAHIDPKIVVDDQTHTAKIIWTIEHGKRDFFGKTIIIGASGISIDPILSCLRYKEGDSWSQQKMRESFAQIKSLDIFNALHLSSVKSPFNNAEHIILLKLQDTQRWEFRTRLGFELQQILHYKNLAGITYKVGGTLIVKNPARQCDQLRCDLDVTKLHRELVLRYCWPCWQWHIPCLAWIQGFSIKHEQPGFIGANKNIYTFTQNGVLFALQHKGDPIEGEVNIGLQFMETKMSEDNVGTKFFARELARAINFEPKLLGKQILYAFIEPTLFIDVLDNKINPTKGTLTVLSCKGMFPLHKLHMDGYFVRLLLEQSCFFAISPLVVALRFRLGHIFHQEFSAIMPAERFYLGGSRSVRSYESDLAPPIGEFIDQQGKVHTVPRGGKSMMNGNIELRFPVFKNFSGVVFQDIGLLSGDSFADLKIDHLVAGTGFGLRYTTPIGPLRFDIGWKWYSIKPFERSYAWFLTFGNAF